MISPIKLNSIKNEFIPYTFTKIIGNKKIKVANSRIKRNFRFIVKDTPFIFAYPE